MTTKGTIDLRLEVRWFVRPALKVAAAICVLLYFVMPSKTFEKTYPAFMRWVGAVLSRRGVRVRTAHEADPQRVS